MENLQRRDPPKPKVISFTLRSKPARAFALERFQVMCPVCSKETRVPATPRRITEDGDGVFTCFGCQQMFLYNPFVDKPREELYKEKLIEEARLLEFYDALAETFVEGFDIGGL